MTHRLDGKTAFVTAAGQGIGRATVEAFVREGARVIATDIDETLLVDLARATGCETRRLDVTDADADAAAARSVGAVHILFNGVGHVHAGTILDCDERAFEFSFDLNVRAMYRTTRAFLPAMLDAAASGRSLGSIVNVASVAGSLKGAGDRRGMVKLSAWRSLGSLSSLRLGGKTSPTSSILHRKSDHETDAIRRQGRGESGDPRCARRGARPLGRAGRHHRAHALAARPAASA